MLLALLVVEWLVEGVMSSAQCQLHVNTCMVAVLLFGQLTNCAEWTLDLC